MKTRNAGIDTGEEEETMGTAIAKQPLTDWIEANAPKEEMFWCGNAKAQFELLMRLRSVLFSNEFTGDRCASVIGTHRSKSIELPVVEFQLPKLRLVLRDNFYNWKVSVQSDDAIDIDPSGLFDPSIEHSSCYCEGFAEWDVFDSYVKDKRKFTIEIFDDKKLFDFCAIVVGINLPADPPKPDSPSE